MFKSTFKPFISAFFLAYISTLSFTYAKPPQSWPSDGVLIFPEATNNPILEAIQSARKSIDIALYRLEDRDVIKELLEAGKRGIQVRIILQKPNIYPEPFANSKNEETAQELAKQNIKTHYLKDHQYILTHYKFMVVDQEYALIQTLNHDDFNFNKARNFAIATEEPKQIASLIKIFDNDFTDASYKNDENARKYWTEASLILGPKYQRELMTKFLETAKSSIYIYQQDISDADIAQTLYKLGKSGIKIHLIMPPVPFGGIDMNRINHTIFKAAGGEVRFLPKKPLYIHAKVVLIDPEADGQAYVGSCNFWPQALSVQRELGIVTNKKDQVKRIFEVFSKDWADGVSYEEALEASKG